MRVVAVILLGFTAVAFAQEQPAATTAAEKATPELTARQPSSESSITLPSGTKVPLVLKHAITTKTAKEGDSIYTETNFPVVIDGRMAIPPGTYVQGVITKVVRAGKVKGRSELLVHFTSMIFPSGYTVMLPGAVDNVPGQENSEVKDKEGTMQGPGGKAKDAGTIATSAGTGAVIGGLASQSGKGVGIGGAAGAAVGLATVLFTRGPDVRIESGSTVEMVLQRSVTFDTTRTHAVRN
jgi:hypothetical protein